MMIGFFGAGNMATAMIQGMIRGGIAPETLGAFDLDRAKMDALGVQGVRTFESGAALAGACDVTVLAVKPKHMQGVLADLREHAQVRDVLSIALGWTQAMLSQALPGARGIAHAMPNTPTQVQAGVIAINDNHTFDPAHMQALVGMLQTAASVVFVPETQFDAVTGISGSGPAYVYLFIEALADAGVRQGLARDLAYTLAAKTVLGAGKMVLETGIHPGALKDAVCSPGGSTIEAVYALEKAGLRAAVMDAVDACAQKAAKAGKA